MELLSGDLDVGKGLHGRLGCRRRAVAVGIVLGELLDELLQAGSNEVVAEVGRDPEGAGLGGLVVEDELDVGSAGD